MKRKSYQIILMVILCVVFIALALTGCKDKRTKLVVGMDIEFPPYSYKDGDKFVGFDVEMAAAVCDLEGWTVEYMPINWDEKDTLLNDGTIDCVWSGFTINDREDEYTLTKPYCDNSIVVAVPVDSDIKTIDDLTGKIVGVQAASSSAEYLTGDDKGKEIAKKFKLLSQFSDFAYSFGTLSEGALDALVVDKKVAEYFVNNGDFHILDSALLEEQYGVALKKGNTELCEILNDDLQKLADNKTVLKLAQKYEIEDSLCIGDD